MWRGFNVGASWLPTSGTPITDFLAHPAYLNAGEIPVCPDGTFTCPGGPRGAEGRTAWTFDFNLHADYTIKFGERMRVKFVADLFNIFNEQKVIRVNQMVAAQRRRNESGFPEARSPTVRRSVRNSVQRPLGGSLRVLTKLAHRIGEVFGSNPGTSLFFCTKIEIAICIALPSP